MSIEIDEIILEIAEEQETLDYVKELLQMALFEQGVEGKEYADSTIKVKKRKGQPTNRVTLKDSGDFYDSWVVSANNNGFVFTSDPTKGDYSLFDDYDENLVFKTMDEETLDKLYDHFTLRIINKLNQKLYDTLGL
tara:strand:- start:206 stop:613 length:408 start_codon:yes stop_codon:yes gene_type:complete